jgi:glycosyltransferase involved in cell wall biosynthesis
MATTAARLLDMTRIMSRAGRTLTGVDRVELAYAERLVQEPVPVFGLMRTSLGYLLLDRAGMSRFVGQLRAGDWGSPDLVSRMSFRLGRTPRAAQSRARELAIARCVPPGLGAMLRRHLPPGTGYLNIGHSNLTDRVFAAVRSIRDARIAVLIHDTIPLDHPEWQREGSVESFAAKIARTSRLADLVICASQVVRQDVERHMAAIGRVPKIIVASLGLTRAVPDEAALAAALPPGVDLSRPYFVTLGTIEPRKNHALLLDVWDELAPGTATLFVCGRRGWRNEAVFARLDSRPAGVIECPDVSDGAVMALLLNARALLFPSFAEGFGLPLIEAAAAGVPVLCGDLAINREVLGPTGIYLEVTDRYAWADKVGEAVNDRPSVPVFTPPEWDAHFNIVLSTT